MKLLHYALVLGLICLASAFGVVQVYELTKTPIEAKERDAREAAQKVVVPSANKLVFETLNPEAPESDRVERACDGSGKTLGYTAVGQGKGYGSKPITVMVGLDGQAGKIVGLTIVSQQETPGLGTRIAEVKSNKTIAGWLAGHRVEESADTTPEFLRQFRGRAPDEIVLKSGGAGHIQGITGATKSSRGVAKAVRDAVRKIRKVAGARPSAGARQ